MTTPARPARTTVLVGLLLALLLAVAYAVVSLSGRTSAPVEGPAPLPPFPTVPSQTPPPDTPKAGSDFPVRKIKALTDRSALINGRGNADLRYRRAAHNGTRLHFICTGCGADTWLVELPRGNPVAGGALPDPDDVIWALDTVRPGGTTSLLVKAPPKARWTVTLTPFDSVPVHEVTFDALGDDVVAVRARTDLQLRCGGPAFLRTLARKADAEEYTVLELRQEDDPGTWPVTAPTSSDLIILMVSCPGRWTITVP